MQRWTQSDLWTGKWLLNCLIFAWILIISSIVLDSHLLPSPPHPALVCGNKVKDCMKPAPFTVSLRMWKLWKTFPTCCVRHLKLSEFPRGRNGQQRHWSTAVLGALPLRDCMDGFCLWWMLVLLVLLLIAGIEKLSWLASRSYWGEWKKQIFRRLNKKIWQVEHTFLFLLWQWCMEEYLEYLISRQKSMWNQ